MHNLNKKNTPSRFQSHIYMPDIIIIKYSNYFYAFHDAVQDECFDGTNVLCSELGSSILSLHDNQIKFFHQ